MLKVLRTLGLEKCFAGDQGNSDLPGFCEAQEMISVLIQALVFPTSSNGWERKICPQKYPNSEGLSSNEEQQTQAPSALYSQILNSPAGSSTWKMEGLRHGWALSL